MKKKLLIILVIMFAVLIKIDNVSAAENCNCYYTGELPTEHADGSTYLTKYLAHIHFDKDDFDKVEDKHDYYPTITFFGERGFNETSGESGRVIDETSITSWVWQHYDPSILEENNWLGANKKFRAGVDADQVSSLFDGGCNCASLGLLSFFSCADSKTIYYNYNDHFGFEILGNHILDRQICGLGWGVRQDLELITEEEFQEMKNSENLNETAQDLGYSSTVDVSTIVNWANEHGYGDEINAIGDPCYVIDGELEKLLSIAFWLISIVGIVLLVVMTSISFIKAIVGSDEEKLKDAFSHLVTRIIVVIILLLLPMILTFIINIINSNLEGEVSIGEDGNVFCDVTNNSN